MHPTSIHRTVKPKEPNENERERDKSLSLATRSNSKTACPAIPVIVRNKLNNECITTYAALDSFSTSCYMDDALRKKLCLHGYEQSLSITTIEGDSTKMKVRVVLDIEIKSLNGDYSVNVPKLYSKKN